MVRRSVVGSPAGTRAAGVILLVILVVAGGLFFALVRWPNTGQALATHASPVLYTVPTGSLNSTQATSVSVRTVTPAPALAPGWDGIVTRRYSVTGSVLRQGEPLFEVNGQLVRAGMTTRPFFRPIVLGDSGDDVNELRGLLRSAGFAVDGTGAADIVLARAVQRWFGTSGQLNQSAPIFEPDQVVWTPDTSSVVQSLAVDVGAPAPSAGAIVLTFAPRAVSATVALSHYSADLHGVTANIDGVSYEVRADQLSLTPLGARTLGAETAASPGSDSGQTDSSLASISTETKLSATVTLRWTHPVVSIPTSAILARANGTLCIVRRTPDGFEGAPLTVLASSTASELSQTFNLSSGTSIVVNALDSNLGDKCGN